VTFWVTAEAELDEKVEAEEDELGLLPDA